MEVCFSSINTMTSTAAHCDSTEHPAGHTGPARAGFATVASAGVIALLVAGVLGGLGQSVAGSAGALPADRVGGATVTGLPQAMIVIGGGVSALWLSRVTGVRGRGPALGAGALIAAAGGVAVIAAAWLSWLPLVLAGSLLLGAGNTAVMLGRYAAAELVPGQSRARAMALVLTATTVGAVAGPNLLGPTSALGVAIGLPPLAGPYALAGVVFFLAALVLLVGLHPSEGQQPDDRSTPDRIHSVHRSGSDPAPGLAGWTRSALAGLWVLGLANLVMVSVMTMAPIRLAQRDQGLGLIGLVVSVHIAGMYAPSELSGRLNDGLGPARTTALSALVLTGSCVGAALATSPAALTAAMVGLGMGWNLALITGSTLLTADVPAPLRARREGRGEAAMALAACGGGAVSGLITAGLGYPVLAAAGAVVALAMLPAARTAGQPAHPTNIRDTRQHSRTPTEEDNHDHHQDQPNQDRRHRGQHPPRAKGPSGRRLGAPARRQP